ncbi:MAG TPA: 16S rRNA (guanine(527)-N(7))-methyltransferase RsmG [Candidatus Limnocylindria bacterium]|nr:16S rRNA (guanine(527)-N(7))-methyltransferase RsmG [Candidatus Limnocylindria bacterium]
MEKAGADSASTVERLRDYGQLLLEWNRTASNLVSRDDESRLVERHIRESLEPIAWLMESGCQRWLDVGSGGGFPAIPLGMAGVTGKWTLVESRRNKALFLGKVVQVLGLKNFEVINDRVEILAEDQARQATFDAVTSRATMRLTPTLLAVEPLVEPGGTAFLWKGSRHLEEIEAAKKSAPKWRHVTSMTLSNGTNAVARFLKSHD